MSVTSEERLIAKLANSKAYRDAYVAEHVKTSTPLHIRHLREERKLIQAELAEKAKTTQTVISRLEDPNYGNLTLNSLLKIASALDIALLVKFVPFSRLLAEFENLSPQALSVPSFDKELPTLKAWAGRTKKRRRSPSKNSTGAELVVIYPGKPSRIPRTADTLLSVPEDPVISSNITPIAKGITAKTGKGVVGLAVMTQSNMTDISILASQGRI